MHGEKLKKKSHHFGSLRPFIFQCRLCTEYIRYGKSVGIFVCLFHTNTKTMNKVGCIIAFAYACSIFHMSTLFVFSKEVDIIGLFLLWCFIFFQPPLWCLATPRYSQFIKADVVLLLRKRVLTFSLYI